MPSAPAPRRRAGSSPPACSAFRYGRLARPTCRLWLRPPSVRVLLRASFQLRPRRLTTPAPPHAHPLLVLLLIAQLSSPPSFARGSAALPNRSASWTRARAPRLAPSRRRRRPPARLHGRVLAGPCRHGPEHPVAPLHRAAVPTRLLPGISAPAPPSRLAGPEPGLLAPASAPDSGFPPRAPGPPHAARPLLASSRKATPPRHLRLAGCSASRQRVGRLPCTHCFRRTIRRPHRAKSPKSRHPAADSPSAPAQPAPATQTAGSARHPASPTTRPAWLAAGSPLALAD
nr:serine/arginine repetitive matrix protein 1-like [Aegilops tauschii subsp. strangulata]